VQLFDPRNERLKHPQLWDGVVGAWIPTIGEAKDFSGNKNHGSYQGGLPIIGSTGGGKSGDAFSFDGVDDYVKITTDDFKFTTSFSTSVWVKADARVTWGRVVDYWGSVSSGGWFIGWNSTNQTYEWRLEQIDNGDGSVVSGTITLGEWYHLTGVYNSATNKGILYVNGVEVDSQTTTGTMPAYSQVDDLGIGARLNPTTTVAEHFNGSIDDVRIYNRLLSTEEIAILAQHRKIAYEKVPKVPKKIFALLGDTDRPIAGIVNNKGWNKKPPINVPINHGHRQAKGLVGMWSMREGTGNNLLDVSGRGNHGTLTNMNNDDWVNSPSNTPRGNGLGLDFDGSNDYVRVSRNSLLEPSNGLTISFWAKSTDTTAAHIVSKLSGSTGFAAYMGPYYYFLVYGPTATFRSSGISPSGEWEHITCVYGKGQIGIYIDGKLITSYASTGTITHATSTDLIIGANANISQGWDASLDDIRIYNRALNAEEIMDLYKNPHGIYQLQKRAFYLDAPVETAGTRTVIGTARTAVSSRTVTSGRTVIGTARTVL
jgi:hypothetical protein